MKGLTTSKITNIGLFKAQKFHNRRSLHTTWKCAEFFLNRTTEDIELRILYSHINTLEVCILNIKTGKILHKE